MDAIFCGASKLPKGKRLGTSTECIQRGQHRLYGLNKVSVEQIKKAKLSKKSKGMSKADKFKKYFTLKGRLSKFKRELKELEKSNLAPQKKQATELRKNIKKIQNDIKALSKIK